MERRSPDSLLAAFVGIGVLCGVALGAVFALIWRDRKASTPVNGLGNGGVHVWNLLGGQMPPSWAQLGAPAPQSVVQTTTPEVNAELRPSVTQTLSLSTTQPVRVLNGGRYRHWRAQMRNVGPPGSIAYVATDPTNLAYPSMSVAIPPGPPMELRIRPGDALFAISTINGTQLSIAASEEIA